MDADKKVQEQPLEGQFLKRCFRAWWAEAAVLVNQKFIQRSTMCGRAGRLCHSCMSDTFGTCPIPFDEDNLEPLQLGSARAKIADMSLVLVKLPWKLFHL